MQANNYTVIRIEKQKTKEEMDASDAHNLRQKFVLNADPNRTKDNKTVVGDAQPLWEKVQERIARDNVLVRSTSVLSLEVILTATHFDGIDLDAWVASNVKFLEKKFGKQNVLRVVLHLDESTPHLHANIIPVVERKNGQPALNARHWLASRSHLRAIQTDYAEAMAPYGLTRGVEGSVASHTDAKTYKRMMSHAVEALPAMLAKIKKICTPPYKVTHRDGRKEELDIKEMKPRLGLVALDVAENNARLAKYQLRSLQKYATAQAETIVAQQVRLERSENETAMAKAKAQSANLIAIEERERARSATDALAELTETINQVNAINPSIINEARVKANEQRNRKRKYSRNQPKATRQRDQASKSSKDASRLDGTNANRRNKLDRG